MDEQETLEPISIAAVRKLLMALVEQAVEGKLLSVFVIAETTSGNMFVARTPATNSYGVAGYTIAAATDAMMSEYYEGEVEEGDDPDDIDMDLDGDEDEDDD